MSNEATTVHPSVFGNLTVPRRSGLLGLSFGGSLALVPIILLIIILVAFGFMAIAITVLAATIVAIALSKLTRKENHSFFGRRMLRFAQRRKERTQQHLYIAGPTGKGTPDGATRLPGLMARSELSDQTDSFGEPFGMIRLSGNGVHNYSVVLETHPDGEALIDQDEMERRVALWGAWLSQRGSDEGIRGASVTIESSPDSGLRLNRLLHENRTEDSPEFSRAVTTEIRDTFQSGAPQVVARITVTFSGKRLDGGSGDRGTAEMAEEIGNRLPAIRAGLAGTGAGSVRPCTAQQITDFTRVAYDPTVATTVEEMQADGGTGLRWEDAGPSFARDDFDLYRHDRAVSKSWTMWEGPNGHFTADSLKRALSPLPGVLRKRVTLLYRPIATDKTTAIVQQEQNDALFAQSQTRGDARAMQRLAAARKTASEEAQGAGLTRFGVILTITSQNSEDFRRWDRQVPGLFSRARLRVRPALANQAVTFQAALPLGLVLPDHMLIPDEIREMF